MISPTLRHVHWKAASRGTRRVDIETTTDPAEAACVTAVTKARDHTRAWEVATDRLDARSVT
jgi:hypothetical protein